MGISPFIKRESKVNGNGLGIVVGSGMLMATMDLLPPVYRFIEYKDVVTTENIQQVVLFGHFADFIAVNAWFSVSKPDSLLYILQHFEKDKIVYYSNMELIGNRCFSLADLKSEVDRIK